MSLLDEILNSKKLEVEKSKKELPLAELKEKTDVRTPCRSLQKAVEDTKGKYGFGIIGEIKKKSPSMKEMNSANVEKALAVYDRSPIISAISVLTDYPYFAGTIAYLKAVAEKTGKPVLRKDFIIDEYQVWEAKANKADAILLMCSVHKDNPGLFNDLYNLARSVNLEVLIEFGVETEPNTEFVPKDAGLFGVNSRKFITSKLNYSVSGLLSKDLTTDSKIHFDYLKKLRAVTGEGKTFIAESGIRHPTETSLLAEVGYCGALIGTTFLKEGDIEKTVGEFCSYIKDSENFKTVK
jgi:indole-3-glycerol phosphate synthase